MSTPGKDQAHDARSGRVLLVGACLLDQNCRFPGIAVEAGACRPLIEALVAGGAGIAGLPCLECLEWGGVRRRRVARLLPVLYRTAGTPSFRLIRLLGRVALAWYAWRCRRAAKVVVDRVADLVAAGGAAMGVVLMNDSPTCGVTRTLALFDVVPEFKRRGHTLDALMDPGSGVLRTVVPAMLHDGSGVFTSALRRELLRKGIDIPFAGYDPWAGDRQAEVARVAAVLAIE